MPTDESSLFRWIAGVSGAGFAFVLAVVGWFSRGWASHVDRKLQLHDKLISTVQNRFTAHEATTNQILADMRQDIRDIKASVCDRPK